MVVCRHHHVCDSSMPAGCAAIRLPLTAWSPAPHDENGRIHPRRRPEGVTRDRAPLTQIPAAPPALGPGRGSVRVAPDDGTLQDQVGGHEPGFGSEEKPQQRARDHIRRARHHAERPARRRWRVSAPSPAPMSRTSSPGRTPASATTRAAHSSVSRCQPHARRDRRPADTTDHDHAATHAPTLGTPPHPGNRFRGVPGGRPPGPAP
jgi:hypothetical protein